MSNMWIVFRANTLFLLTYLKTLISAVSWALHTSVTATGMVQAAFSKKLFPTKIRSLWCQETWTGSLMGLFRSLTNLNFHRILRIQALIKLDIFIFQTTVNLVIRQIVCYMLLFMVAHRVENFWRNIMLRTLDISNGQLQTISSYFFHYTFLIYIFLYNYNNL